MGSDVAADLVSKWPNPADFVRCTNVVSLLRYFGRAAHVIGTTVRDPIQTFAKSDCCQKRSLFGSAECERTVAPSAARALAGDDVRRRDA
jgi:hypothetical protein